MSEDEVKLLQAVYDLVSPTRSELQLYVLPFRAKRMVGKKIQALVHQGYIKPHFLHPSLGRASMRFYTLRHKGALALGKQDVDGRHRRGAQAIPTRIRMAKRALSYLASQYGYQLVSTNTQAISLLLQFLQHKAQEEHHEEFSLYLLRKLIPESIAPDYVLQTQKGLYICIIQSPQGDALFWLRRLQKYTQLRVSVSIICICLSRSQKEVCHRILDREKGGVHLQAITVDEIPSIFSNDGCLRHP